MSFEKGKPLDCTEHVSAGCFSPACPGRNPPERSLLLALLLDAADTALRSVTRWSSWTRDRSMISSSSTSSRLSSVSRCLVCRRTFELADPAARPALRLVGVASSSRARLFERA